MKLILLGILLISLCGCSTTAKKYTIKEDGISKDIVEIDRGMKVEFPDGTKAESEPLFKVPDFPPIKYEQ